MYRCVTIHVVPWLCLHVEIRVFYNNKSLFLKCYIGIPFPVAYSCVSSVDILDTPIKNYHAVKLRWSGLFSVGPNLTLFY